jgi:hypothetical protein
MWYPFQKGQHDLMHNITARCCCRPSTHLEVCGRGCSLRRECCPCMGVQCFKCTHESFIGDLGTSLCSGGEAVAGKAQ